MRNREELAKYFAELGFTKGAEIGVQCGYYSRILLEAIPSLNLLCVDSWSKFLPNDFYEDAVRNLSAYPGCTVLRGASVIVAKMVPDKWLDFVFIDADHSYQSVYEDLQAWVPKVRDGGIVSGHDYFRKDQIGVIRAVDKFIEESGYKLNILGWHVSNPVKDSRQPCWWFVKEHKANKLGGF